MGQIMGFLSSLASIYMMILFVRIILSWFSWVGRGRLHEILARVTDPYLNIFRRLPLRIGFLDLSPIVALAVLSLFVRLFATMAMHQTISIGIILSMVVQMLWGMVSFLIIFLIIVFALRMVAYFARFNIYNPFWRIVDTVYQLIAYRINRTIFKNRIVPFVHSCLFSIACLFVMYFGLRFLLGVASIALLNLPI